MNFIFRTEAQYRWLVIGTLLGSATALAGHPLTTEDVGTQGPGAVEVETSVAAIGGHEGPVELGAGLVVHVGLGDRMDLGTSVVFSGISVDSPELALKWRLLDPDVAPGLAVRVAWTAGSNVGLQLVGSLQRGRFEVHANLGGARFLDDDDAWGVTAASSASYLVRPSLRLGGELLTAWVAGPEAHLHNTALLGAMWEVFPRGTLSVGAGPSWTPGLPPAWQSTLGFTLSVG